MRYEDRDGDTPITLGPALAAGATGFLVDVAFQVGTNVYNGKPAFENYSLSSSLISGGAAFGTVLTGGLLGGTTATFGSSVLIGAGTGGVFGTAESATKQYMETGKIDATKTVTDGIISTVTAGHGETGQQMFKLSTKGETITKAGEYAKDAVFNTVGEITENTGQGVADNERANKTTTKTTSTSTKTTTTSRPQQKGTPGTKVGNLYVAPPLY